MKVFEHHGDWPKSVEKGGKGGGGEAQGPAAAKGKKAQSNRNMKRKERPEGPPPASAQEIRDKVELSKAGKGERPAPAKQVVPMDQESTVEAAEAAPAVSLNDPNDPATVGKLKDMMKGGAVNFSEQQRGVLEKILADRS